MYVAYAGAAAYVEYAGAAAYDEYAGPAAYVAYEGAAAVYVATGADAVYVATGAVDENDTEETAGAELKATGAAACRSWPAEARLAAHKKTMTWIKNNNVISVISSVAHKTRCHRIYKIIREYNKRI